ncbi:MAG: hypothetical protein HY896_12590 [Deltaproteobacteria bacterium]|nr:hypothetical protein [Deltaproteobacteria bacterium]
MAEERSISYSRGAAGWIASLILFAGSVHFSSHIALERKSAVPSAGPHAESGLLEELSRRPSLAFGFGNFLGDVVWLKAVQVSGALSMSRADYDRLYVLLDTAINFDPRFTVPYLLGGMILGDSPNHTGAALQVLARGRKNHPSEWRIPFYIGYIRYFSLGDPVRGGEALFEASRIPGSAPYLPLLASRMLSEGRAPATALAFLERMMDQETNPARRETLDRRMREVIVERDVQMLERAAEEYRRREGRAPERLSDLVSTGMISSVPREPNGGRYIITSEGKVRSNRVSTRLKVFRGK